MVRHTGDVELCLVVLVTVFSAMLAIIFHLVKDKTVEYLLHIVRYAVR